MSSDPRAALLEYVQPLQQALHCITPVKLQHSADEIGVREMFRLPVDPGAELRRREQSSRVHLPSVHLWVDQHVNTLIVSADRAPRRYRTITLGYNYAIVDQSNREILSFHWHPGQRSHEQEPHVHIGSSIVDAGAGDLGKTFSKFHIPTGQISLARVVRLLLTDFNVVPNRQDWEAVLGRLTAAEANG